MRKFRPVALSLCILSLGLSARAAEVVDRIGSVRLHVTPGGLNAGGAPDFAEGIQAISGDLSPGIAESHINDYRYQDEQINILPTDGTVTVLRTDQKNLVQPFITKAFEIHHAPPREIVNAFRILCGKEGGRAEVIMDPKHGKNYIQVICPAFQLVHIKQVLSVIDQPWAQEYNDGSSEIYYRPKFRDAASINAMAFDNGTPDQSLISIDTTNNAVHYLDDPGSIGGYLAIAEQVDLPPHTVTLEGAIYEVERDNDSKIGLDYIAWKNGPGRNLLDFIAQDSDDEILEVLALNQDYIALNALVTAAYVDMLQSKGKAKVVSKFKILTKSGTPGRFERVDQIVSFEAGDLIDNFDGPHDDNITKDPGPDGTEPTQVSGAVSNSGDTVVTVAPRVLRYKNQGQTGIFLDILPYIGTESMEVVINVTLSDLNGYTPQGEPIINFRTVNVGVCLQDGQPYVISGLRRTEKIKQHQGIPFLSRLPIIGYAFGGDTTAERETEYVIVVTPKANTGSQIDMRDAEIVSTIKAQIDEEVTLAMPNNPIGFDQWLLAHE